MLNGRWMQSTRMNYGHLRFRGMQGFKAGPRLNLIESKDFNSFTTPSEDDQERDQEARREFVRKTILEYMMVTVGVTVIGIFAFYLL
ncbi:MAG: hypothetical protein HKN16_03125 [Saprospiraceae bacterium]|nr:hypothetical protein [Saprospiraceae bacterium]